MESETRLTMRHQSDSARALGFVNLVQRDFFRFADDYSLITGLLRCNRVVPEGIVVSDSDAIDGTRLNVPLRGNHEDLVRGGHALVFEADLLPAFLKCGLSSSAYDLGKRLDLSLGGQCENDVLVDLFGNEAIDLRFVSIGLFDVPLTTKQFFMRPYEFATGFLATEGALQLQLDL